mmetsp:Transcript_19908/g.45924  ORF Transcript_19908/g.45924 Transcript_19908/m.45924 type:complete len:217 (+) Transcript_19908:135-785(+)
MSQEVGDTMTAPNALMHSLTALRVRAALRDVSAYVHIASDSRASTACPGAVVRTAPGASQLLSVEEQHALERLAQIDVGTRVGVELALNRGGPEGVCRQRVAEATRHEASGRALIQRLVQSDNAHISALQLHITDNAHGSCTHDEVRMPIAAGRSLSEHRVRVEAAVRESIKAEAAARERIQMAVHESEVRLRTVLKVRDSLVRGGGAIIETGEID